MASTTFISLSLPISLSSSNLLPTLRSSSSPPFPFSTALFSRPTLPLLNPLRQNRQKQLSISRIHAATSQQTLPSDSAALLAAEKSQEIVGSTNDDGVSTIISVLLFTAFIGLSILTIGVIYIGVTDFLQKREKEKFEKEEAGKKKKSGKKKKVRARGGPRGFGQKVEGEEEEDDEN
uniref:Transmembrane protein n=1 Tax=Cucumis sativus TaxID=3659 RepID=A0A0A0KFD7_CUCSA